MSVATAAAADEADSVPQQCIKISKDLLDALVKNLLKSASPGTHAAHLQTRVEQRLAKILPSVKTPDHPPYALMIRQAITELDEEGGSNEEAISEFIKLKYKDLPWGHANFLRHHLKKLKDEEEIFQVSSNRYKLLPEDDDSIGKVKRNIKRKRRSGKEECYSQCKVSKSGGSSKEKNSVDKEDQEKSEDAALHFKEFEVNEKVNQVHLDSEECERTKDATREEALHLMKDGDGIEQQKQEVTCPPRQETILVVEVNEEVSQVHIVEDASREPCVPSQIGSEIGEEADVTPQKECEGMEDVSPTAEASTHFVADGGQVLLQRQEKEFRENQSREVSCSARKQTALGFEVNGEANQLCEQENEKDGVSRKEVERSVAIEEREQVESIDEQKEANCKEDTTIENLQNQMEVDPIQVEEDLDQMEDNSLKIEGEKEETTRNNETEDQQEVICEEQGAAGVSEEQFDGKVLVLAEVGKVPAIEMQEQPMEMQGLSGVLEGKNVNKGAENLVEEQCDGKLQVAVIEKGQVKAVGLQKQQQPWEPEVNEQHLQLKEIGAEILECIENIITPQIPPKLAVGNKSFTREGEACGLAANLISSPALSSPRQEQCLELLSRTAKIQGIVVELLKSFVKAESSRRPSDLAMLESNESELPDEQLPNATAKTTLPSCRDVVVFEPLENVEISCSTRLEGKEAEVSETELPLKLDLPVVEPPPPQENVEEASMLDSQEAVLKDSEEHQEVAGVVEPEEQVEQLCNSSTNTTTTTPPLQLEETIIENHQERQSELHSVQLQVEPPQEPEVGSTLVEEEATETSLLLNLNSTLDVLGFLPEQEALNNKEPSAENYVKNSFQPKLPDLQPKNISSILEGKEIPGHTVSANPTLLSLLLASQEQQQKPSDFVHGNKQLYQQKEELPTPVLKQNAESSFWQQHVQSESQSVNLQKEEIPTPVLKQNAKQSFWQQHVQSESQSVNLQKEEISTPILLKQIAEPSFLQQHVQSKSQSVNLQKEEIPTPVLKQNAKQSFWQQHVQSESQSVNLQKEEIPTPILLKQIAEPSFLQQHVQSKSQSVNLQKEEIPTPILLKQIAEPSFLQQHVQSKSQSVNLQKEELPTPVLLKQNAKPSFWQQHVQSESQSVNLWVLQQKEELPTPVLQQNAEPSFWQQHVQSESQSVNLQKEELPTPVLQQQNAEPSFWQQHVQSESQSVNQVKITVNNEMLQPNLLQGGPKAPPLFGGDANTGIFSTPQKQQQQQPMLLLHGQQKQMLSPQLPSSFDVGSLFGNSLFQQPLTISPMKPSSLSGEKLRPLKPIELKKLMADSVKPTPKPSPAKPMGTPQQVIDVDEIEPREVESSSVGGFKRKLQFQASPDKSPSLMSSDKKVGEVVGESEQVTPKKRRGRPPKQQTPGHTPSPQSRRPKIRKTVPKKKPSAAADGEEGPSSKSPAKQGPCRPKNPF